MTDVFIFAGEQSGDLHGENLIKSLLAKDPHLTISGVGGPRMRTIEKFNCVFPMEKFHVMGFIDVLLALPKLIYQFYFVKNLILKSAPKVVVLIDYPDFNLRMAKHLAKSRFGGKVCHYVCPSIWAWRKNRIHQMEKFLDFLFCILPFEKQYFKDSPLNVKYVGHPLIKRLEEYPYAPFSKEKKIIGIFPGSRKKEIERNFPLQLDLLVKLHREFPGLLMMVSLSHPKFTTMMKKMIEASMLPSELVQFVPQNKNYDLMRCCHIAIAKSGTVTLELALHKVPTVVVYGITQLDYFIARYLLKINLPFYSLPNIIDQSEVFPELIGPNLTKEKLYASVKHFLLDESARNECTEKCNRLYTLLKERDTDGDIAEVLHSLIHV